MSHHARACALASAVVLAALASGARATILDGVQPAALDQPQINMIVYVGTGTNPQIGVTPNPLGGLPGFEDLFPDAYFFNVQAYLDTGASGILISNPTSHALNITTETMTGIPVIYADVGVAGSDNFNVSVPVRIRLAPYIPGQDMDQFNDLDHADPQVGPYSILVNNDAHLRVQVGPFVPTVDTPGDDEFDQLIAALSNEGSALDVVGMPALRGHVMVVDPRGVKDLGLLFAALSSVLSGSDPDDDTPDIDLTTIGNAGVKTYLYTKANAPAFDPTRVNDPGIPQGQRHVALSYGSFERFTEVTLGPGGPALPGLPAPALDHNPFIGKNPVALLEQTDPGNAPGITITRTVGQTVLPATGNWLLDTGAAASIISEDQAALLHVIYDRAGGHGPGAPAVDPDADPTAPILIDSITHATIDNQFTLVLGGIGGQTVLAGFWLDTLLLPTKEAALYGNDELNIYYHHVPVLVGNITVADPQDPTKTLTLDGIFGMNMLIESLDFQTDLSGNLTDISDPSPNFFDWITIDLTSDTQGELGLTFDPETVPDAAVPVPEPASLLLLSSSLALLLARRPRRSAV